MKRALGALLLIAVIAITPIAMTPTAANAATIADLINTLVSVLRSLPGGASYPQYYYAAPYYAPYNAPYYGASCRPQVNAANAATVAAVIQTLLQNPNSPWALNQAAAICQGIMNPWGVYPGYDPRDMKGDK